MSATSDNVRVYVVCGVVPSAFNALRWRNNERGRSSRALQVRDQLHERQLIQTTRTQSLVYVCDEQGKFCSLIYSYEHKRLANAMTKELESWQSVVRRELE